MIKVSGLSLYRPVTLPDLLRCVAALEVSLAMHGCMMIEVSYPALDKCASALELLPGYL